MLKHLKDEKDKIFRFFRGALAGIAAVLGLSFLFTIYAPMELYLTNMGEFWFDFYYILPYTLVLFGIVTLVGVVLILVLYFFNKKIYYTVTCIVFTALTASYVQGNFLLYHLPSLGGESVNWDIYGKDKLITVLVWLLIGTLLVVLTYRLNSVHMESVIRIASMGLSAVLFITWISLVITSRAYVTRKDLMVTTEKEYEMSSNTNFIILLLDAVEGETFQTLLEEHPEYKETFEDFTFYNNALSMYNYTQFSVPQILTGYCFDNSNTYEEYWKEALRDSKLFQMLEQNSYRMCLYDEELVFSKKDNEGRFDNIVTGKYEGSSHIGMMKVLLKMGAIKYAPYSVKRHCYDLPDKVRKLKSTEGSYEPYEWGNIEFYDRMIRQPVTYTDSKCFKFFHLRGAHAPFELTPELEVLEKDNMGSYEWNVQASIKIVDGYLNKLKEADCFDNSVIIVMADHGYHMSSMNVNPILFVKGKNEHHEFMISDIPISYEDLGSVYEKLVAQKSSNEIFPKQGNTAVRRFMFYEYGKETHIMEYFQPGHATDGALAYPSGKEYNAKITS